MLNVFARSIPARQGQRSIRYSDFVHQIEVLEDKAKKAPFGADAYIFNDAGDLCVTADREFDARRYYGMAIDGFLDAGRFEVAGAIARKMLRLYPDVVRARCTLAWIAIGRGIRPEMASALRDYTDAALGLGMDRPLVRELTWMADIVDDREVLFEIGERLLDGGASAEADHVFGRAFWNPREIVSVDSPWAYIVDCAKRDAWQNEGGRRAAGFVLPDDVPELLPPD